MGRLAAGCLVGLLLLAGCGPAGPGTAGGVTGAFYSAEAAPAPAPAGGMDLPPNPGAYQQVFSLGGTYDAVFRAPGFLLYGYFFSGGEDWQGGLGYRRYSKELGETGWPRLDAFLEKAACSGLRAGYADLGGNSIVNLDAGWGIPIGENTVLDIALDGLWLEGTPDSYNASGRAGFTLYLADTLRLAGGYRYSRIMDGGSTGYQFWDVGVDWLLGASGIVLGASYQREDINGSAAGSNMVALSFDWYMKKAVALGFESRFIRDTGGGLFVGDANLFRVGLGLQLGNSVLHFGWEHLVVVGGSTAEGYSLVIEMPY